MKEARKLDTGGRNGKLEPRGVWPLPHPEKERKDGQPVTPGRGDQRTGCPCCSLLIVFALSCVSAKRAFTSFTSSSISKSTSAPSSNRYEMSAIDASWKATEP